MKRYKRRIVEVEAFQMSKDFFISDDIPDWFKNRFVICEKKSVNKNKDIFFLSETPGSHSILRYREADGSCVDVDWGDWLCRGGCGTIFIMSDDGFKREFCELVPVGNSS